LNEGRTIHSAAFVASALGISLLAADQGGFFPRTWPWAGLAFGAVAALTIVLVSELRTRQSAFVLVGGLALLTAWTAWSALWSLEPQTSLREAVRAPIYVAAALAFTALASAGGSSAIVCGVATAAIGTAGYSLIERLVHGVHPSDQQASLLERPLGYANALGVLCAIGLVIVLVSALGARTRRGAVLGVVAVVPLGIALALTGSRGGWVAAVAGLAIGVVFLARGRRWATAVALAVGLMLAILSVVPAFSIPARMQARGDYWHVAWHVAGDHPLVGTGAGTYDLAWAAFGDVGRWRGALDAHSLYVESLAELGVIGLLLVAVLLAPVVSGLRAERPTTTLAAGLGGAVTFLVHAGLDWDWEMPAVTVAGIACLAAVLGSAEPRLRVGRRVRAGALTLSLSVIVAEFVFLVVRK
jgi:O-antigen ligase